MVTTGCDNKGVKDIYRCKLKTVWWCDYGNFIAK